jgi:hypothetical protein
VCLIWVAVFLMPSLLHDTCHRSDDLTARDGRELFRMMSAC